VHDGVGLSNGDIGNSEEVDQDENGLSPGVSGSEHFGLEAAEDAFTPRIRGLHSSTLQLNLSASCVTGGALRGCFGGV
jgi:hypothetical protein